MQLKLTFSLEKETKGAVRYAEDGMVHSDPTSYKIGTLYIRKTALEVPYPRQIVVTVE